MQLCLEQAFSFLQERGEAEKLTYVLVESWGRKEDADLELLSRRICDGANVFGQRLPFEVVFVDKKQNLPSLQLVDLVCHPIGRYLLKPDQPNRAYDVVEKKLYCSGKERLEGVWTENLPLKSRRGAISTAPLRRSGTPDPFMPNGSTNSIGGQADLFRLR